MIKTKRENDSVKEKIKGKASRETAWKLEEDVQEMSQQNKELTNLKNGGRNSKKIYIKKKKKINLQTNCFAKERRGQKTQQVPRGETRLGTDSFKWTI